MVSVSSHSLLTPTLRHKLYKIITFVMIGAVLLQPVTAIAVIDKSERVKALGTALSVPSAVENGALNSRSTPAEMAATDRLRTAAALPKPAKRMLAQVNPTPSYARPVYPYNHILDGSLVPLGSPPVNHDFEAPPVAGEAPPFNHDFQLPAVGGGTQPANYDFQASATSGGSPPANHQFSAASYQVGTPPTNHNFATGTLTGWSATGTVAIANDPVYGNWARVSSGGSITSSPFTVDSSAQRITFALNHFSAGTRLYLHRGGTRTEIAYLYCGGCGWRTYSIPAAPYYGQSISLELRHVGGSSFGLDEVRMDVLLPDYTVAGAVGSVAESNGNVYARLSDDALNPPGVLTTAAFVVGSEAQKISLSLIGLTATNDQYSIHVLSGATYSFATWLGSGTAVDSWQNFTYSISQWQGQSIKLRFSLGSSGSIGIDDVGIQSTILPNYKTSGLVDRGEESNGNIFAKLQNTLNEAAVITTTTFVIGSNVRELKLAFKGLTSASDEYKVHLLSTNGATLATLANVGTANDGWQQTTYFVSQWQGQSVKLRISSRYGAVAVDDIGLQTATLSGYTIADGVTQVEEANGNRYARLAGNGVITTTAFTVGSAVQQLTLWVFGLTATVDNYIVQTLSGPGYSTVTTLASGVTADDSWQQITYNVTVLQGQSIKLRISNYNQFGAVGIDNLGIQAMILPGWTISGNAALGDEGNGNHYVSTDGALTSSFITLDSNLQQIALRYRGVGSTVVDRFTVKVLRSSTGEEIIVADNVIATTNWQTLKIGLNRYAGETVRLKLQKAYGRVHFDNVGEGEALLRGWQITTADGIATGADSHGSYVTSAQGTNFTIHSGLIGLGLIDRPNRADARYYSIGYDLDAGEGLTVYWRNEQGHDYTVLPIATDTPTGYRESYFSIRDILGTVGRFYIKVTGAGKVYSIADNIARQQLNEPFSYKVGLQIDTASGSFGYQAYDLSVDGLLPLRFTRYYNGHSDRLGPLGYGWSHSYETRLAITGDGDVGVIFGSGKELFFIWNNTSQSFTAADVRVHDQLRKNSDGTYTYLSQGLPPTPYSTDAQCTLPDAIYTQLRPQRQEFHFTNTGQLLAVQDHNGQRVTLQYNPTGQLTGISEPGGATFALVYNGVGQLTEVQSSLGATAMYGYDGADLTSVTRSDRGVETYSYDEHRLAQVIDANGQTLIHNLFDAYHRVIAQEDAHFNRLTITYDTPAAGVTAVHNPAQNGVSSFYHDQYQRTTDWVAPTGEITSYLYDGNGNLQKVIDSGFGHWNFAYDTNADLLGITDPQGNPLVISYNPERLPTTMTDGNGNVTTIQYDAVGNITQSITGGEETVYTYTPQGKIATVTSPWRQERYTYYPLDGSIQAGKLATRSLGAPGAEKTWLYTYERFVQEGVVLGRKEHVTDPNGHTSTTIYDRANRIVALRDHTGAQKKFLYDPVGHLLMAEDELGRRTYWDYNAVGLVEKKIDPEGFTTLYTYDANRNMTAMTDPNGLVTAYTYDDNNRLKKTALPGNRVSEYWYDGCGRVTAQQNPRGQVTTYDYDPAGQLITMTMPLNTVYTFEYDGNGNLKKAIDPQQTVTEHAYDALNRPLTVKDGAGFITQYQYDKDNREIRVINPLGETTTYRYNLLGQMTAMVNPLQQTTAFAYDGVGNRVAITDTLGYVERFVYDAVNRPEYYKNKAGRITQFVYDAAGQLKQTIEPTTQATRVTHFDYWGRGMLKSVTNALAEPPAQYFYDAGGRLTHVQEPDGKGTKYHYYPDTGLLEKVLDRVDKATRYEYDPMGNVTAVIDPLGRRATFEYDELNRLKKAAAPNSPPTEYKYYANGKLKELWTPAQRPTYYAYDGRGLVTSVTDAFGRAMNYSYDEAGRLKTVTDRRQGEPNVLTYTYDAGGRLTDLRASAAFNNLGVHYAYDGGNRLAAVTDPNGQTTSYTYNALGQVRTETQPIGRTTTYTYDEYNRLWVTEDPRGVDVTYNYDALDRVKQVTYPGGQNTFEYDILGRLDWYSDSTGVTNYGYDDASRVNQIVAPQGAVAYGYADDGKRNAMTLDAGAPDARTINYGYNDKGQLATITDWQGRTNTLTYDVDGNVAGIARYNNVNTAYTYDAAGRLDSLNHNGPAGALAWFDYTLDEMGNRTALDSAMGHEDYGIDGLNRLSAASYAGGSESYQYHPNGDRQYAAGGSETYAYNANGQLESVGAPMLADSFTFLYDANGNVTTAADGAQQSDSYTWDWANRLTSATVDGQTVNYAYDAMGVRVSTTISGTTQNLLWDRMAELPLLVDDGSQSYVHGAGPLAQIDTNGTRYDLLADGLGSVRNLIDGSGAVVGAADYSMFGEYRNQTGVTSRFGFTGEYYAQETGMWHLRARDLHPGLGRFLSADPVQPNAPGTQGYNRYAYAANNPTTWVDPSGYSAEPVTADQALLNMMYAMRGGLVGVLRCALSEECRDLKALVKQLGSRGANLITWTAEELQQALFSTYPHQPTPVDPGLLALSIGLSNTPVIGDLYDLYTGVTGYDPITGQYLAGWERLANMVGALPIFGISGANLRHGEHAFESLIDNGDELAQVVSAGAKTCSFDEETPVATDEGTIPIREVDVGDHVLAWNETVGQTDYYTVTDTYTSVHEVLVYLTIDGEELTTTPEHPFLKTDGAWTPAGQLEVGNKLRRADGEYGTVEAIEFAATPQVMYNMTVADAHTYTVGDGEWLVHNACSKALRKSLEGVNALPFWTKRFEWRAHHVIPGKLENHRFVQRVQQAGWYIDGASNGMALPYLNTAAARLGLPSHRGNHQQYSREVEQILDALEESAISEGWTNREARRMIEDLVFDLRRYIMSQPAGTHLR